MRNFTHLLREKIIYMTHTFQHGTAADSLQYVSLAEFLHVNLIVFVIHKADKAHLNQFEVTTFMQKIYT